MRDYKTTVYLPKTVFPMRANLPQRELEILQRWEAMSLGRKMRQARQGCEKFIVHDGPPYANGHIHMGTAFNKILKDIVNRLHFFLGKDVIFVPVWDCHGLPIEWKIEERYRENGKNKDDVPILEFRGECREFATYWMGVQREEFIRLGLIGDWDHPLSTMAYHSEARIVGEIGKFLFNGSLYQGIKPVLWSVVEKTALAEAEVEYKDHLSLAVYVRFPIKASSYKGLEGASAVIWTTTPWTLPGNRAVAYGEDISYHLLDVTAITQDSQAKVGESLLVAKDLVEAFCSKVGIARMTIRKTMQGHDLKGTLCKHPLARHGYDFDVPLLPADHVTIETGTGLVHTAPGHGIEDFAVGQRFNLPIPATVAEDGYYYKDVPLVGGQHIFKANDPIMEALRDEGAFLHHEKLLHSYPHSWRSKAPLIYRTTAQWFISMERESLREKALQAIDKVQWFPPQARRRLESMVRDRPDWCVSRQRAWGTPLAIFIHKKTGEPLRDERVQKRIIDAIAQEGADVWLQNPGERFLKPDYDPDDYAPVNDVLDVWFDAGSTHAFVLEDHPDLTWPADVYLEGSDQHRGWFQASLLEACGTRGKAPFKEIITHGFVNDEQGRKMSKSLGNTIAPKDLISKMGAEILRLWVINADYAEDPRIGSEILKHQEDIYRRLRNTLRYLLGGLEGFTPREHVRHEEMPALERWALHRLVALDRFMRDSIQRRDFQSWFAELHTFCATDLSAFYFDIRKDVLYCDKPEAIKRRAMRTVFDHLFNALTIWLAPVLCFTADEAWSTRYPGTEESVHLQTFPTLDQTWEDKNLAQEMSTLRAVRRVMTGALEKARNEGAIGSSLQGHIRVYDPLRQIKRDVDWEEFSIASKVSLLEESVDEAAYTLPEIKEVGAIVTLAPGEKCQRCWKVLPDVGKNLYYPDICNRCIDVVGVDGDNALKQGIS